MRLPTNILASNVTSSPILSEPFQKIPEINLSDLLQYRDDEQREEAIETLLCQKYIPELHCAG
jgi:hypothetical protein